MSKGTNFDFRLKPCPFCGELIRILTRDLSDQFYVECETCQAMGPTGGEMNSAVIQWNSRAESENKTRDCLRCGRQLLLEKEAGYRMCCTCRKVAEGTNLNFAQFEGAMTRKAVR